MRVLIIDDEEFVRLMLEQALREEGCDVSAAKEGRAGIRHLESAAFDCVITDLRMPGLDGRAVLAWVKAHQPDVDVVVLTGHGEVKDAVEAIKQGAWDFLIKGTPFDGTAVTAALAKLRRMRALRRENLAARRGGYRQDAVADGPSRAWQALKAQIARVAPAQAPVLIQGETGSGKEVVARLLHELSTRSSAPFLAVNCGSVSQELLESELFGHERGAFTGAAASKPGLITAADGGTLFLDELGEMPMPMQVSLLRCLDRGEYRPVGGTRTLQADVRIVGATNRDLGGLLASGRFREDLYYRLNTVTLTVPPLRERADDMPVLVAHILSTLRVPGSQTFHLSDDAWEPLRAYEWPGNIRELRNVIERAALLHAGVGPLGRDEIIQALPRRERVPTADSSALLSLEEVERRHVSRVLAACGGNKTQAAKVLQIDYKTLLSKLKP